MAKADVEPARIRRSLLFVPGSDARKIERAAEAGADALILDLEDSVAAEKKVEAREMVAAAIAAKRFGKVEVAVRVNPPGTDHFAADVESLVFAGRCTIMLSKCESARAIAEATRGLPAKLLLLIETPLGVVNAFEIAKASASVEALCFGPADFSLAMGLAETDASKGITYHARCNLVIAAKAAGIAPIDSVFLAVKEEAAFREDALLGKRLGYEGKLCIHPRQVAITNEVYSPSENEIARARRILEAWEEAKRASLGVIAVDGEMIDAPVVAAQRRVLDRAKRAPSS